MTARAYVLLALKERGLDGKDIDRPIVARPDEAGSSLARRLAGGSDKASALNGLELRASAIPA